jgi:hypothetical protein
LKRKKFITGYLASHKEANKTDRREDKKFGSNKRGDMQPEELTRREIRFAKIMEVKKILEEEAKRNEDNDDPPASGPPMALIKSEKNDKSGKEAPPDSVQRNFTDPGLRFMPNQKTFIRAIMTVRRGWQTPGHCGNRCYEQLQGRHSTQVNCHPTST